MDKKNVPIALTATKIDLLKGDNTSLDVPMKYAQEKGLLFHKTSAKNNLGVNSLFEELICKHLKVPNLDRQQQNISTRQIAQSNTNINTYNNNSNRIHMNSFDGDTSGMKKQSIISRVSNTENTHKKNDGNERTGIVSQIAKLCCG